MCSVVQNAGCQLTARKMLLTTNCFVVQCCHGKGVWLDCFAPRIIAFWNEFRQSLYGIELVTFYGKYCYRSGICKRKSPEIYQKRQWSSQTVANIRNFLSLLDWRITASLCKKLYLTMHYPNDQRVLGILRKHFASKLLLHYNRWCSTFYTH